MESIRIAKRTRGVGLSDKADGLSAIGLSGPEAVALWPTAPILSIGLEWLVRDGGLLSGLVVPSSLVAAVQQSPRGVRNVGLRDRFTRKLADALSGLKSEDCHEFDLTVQLAPENLTAPPPGRCEGELKERRLGTYGVSKGTIVIWVENSGWRGFRLNGPSALARVGKRSDPVIANRRAPVHSSIKSVV